MHLPTLMQDDYDWAVIFLAAACVLDFFSGELVVGSKHIKLHIVHHNDMAAYWFWTLIKLLCTVMASTEALATYSDIKTI